MFDGQLDDLSHKNFSYQTNKKIRWVKNMFVDWRNYRNSISPGEIIYCDLDNVETIDKNSVLFAVPCFITEVKNLDGSEFPSKTLYDIVICHQFYLENLGFTFKLLNDDKFTKIRFTLDNVIKKRVAEGVDGAVCHAQVLSFTDTDLLWSLELLGIHSTEVLINTVVVMLGLSCALRAGEQHRSLQSPPFNSQFEFLYDDNGQLYFKYKEDVGNKTNKGGIKQCKLEPKEVYVYQTSDSSHSPVRIINYYLGLLPEKCNCKEFYLQP